MTVRARRPVRDLLTRSVIAAAAAGLVCAVAGLAVRGLPGLFGGALAAMLVVAFLLVGQIPIAAAARGRGGLGALLLLTLYSVRVWLLLVTYAVVVASGDAVDREVLGVTLIACALAWTAATVWTAVHWKPTLIDPEN